MEELLNSQHPEGWQNFDVLGYVVIKAKRESSKTKKPVRGLFDSPTAVRNAATEQNRGNEPVVITYDALDYRLMATFPASDAVAKY